MRQFFFHIVRAAMVFASILLTEAATAETAPQASRCVNELHTFMLEEQIKGCTALIESGKLGDQDLAVSYNNRGLALENKGDLDHALVDYDKAIALNPKVALFYFNRAILWRDRDDSDRALADYNRAIDLNPKYAEAYINRGTIWEIKGEFDRAMADYDQATALEPSMALPYFNRGNIRRNQGNFIEAVSEYDQAIKLNPQLARAYSARGIANLYSGAHTKALADLDWASMLNPKFVYTALWLDILNKRSGLPSELAEEDFDMTKWPAPIVRLYLGHLSIEELLAAADDPDPRSRKRKVCQANFFAGELTLQQNKTDAARRLFSVAAAECPANEVERISAVTELKQLKINSVSGVGTERGQVANTAGSASPQSTAGPPVISPVPAVAPAQAAPSKNIGSRDSQGKRRGGP